jgi:tetratricopeptide (TPR) repeat protein
MAKRKAAGKRLAAGKEKKPTGDRVGLRRVDAQTCELVHPRGVHDRALDIAEVQQMLAAGEIDLAIDELRWLLDGCHPFIEAHQLLGEIALGDGDLELAQNHFGYAWQLGLNALPKSGAAVSLRYQRPANQPFLQAGKGLAWCFLQVDKPDQARQVIEQLLALDSDDPLGVRQLNAAEPKPEQNREHR